MGLNFQTCTIINRNSDADSKGKELFEVSNGVLRIKRDFNFEKDCIQAIRGAKGTPAVSCVAEVDFEKLIEDLKNEEGNSYCRMDIYVKYEGAEPFYGANPLHIQKGIPFWVEFTVKKNDTAEAIAAAIEKQIRHDHLFLIDKDIINVSVEGAKLVLSGATEYQRFETINISKFGLADNDAELVAELSKEEGAAIFEVERGVNGFGTYSQIVKDLRLPTAANYQWTHIRQAETPIIDAIYNQYIIEYCAPASNEGTQFVGHRGMSHTTHVFWVNVNTVDDAGNKLIDEWESALAEVGSIEWAE